MEERTQYKIAWLGFAATVITAIIAAATQIIVSDKESNNGESNESQPEIKISIVPESASGQADVIEEKYDSSMFTPLVKTAPKYPISASSRGIEGYCTVTYTITSAGNTENISILDCPNKVFARASMRAAAKFKYVPQLKNGRYQKVDNVKNKFVFEIPDHLKT